MQIRPGADQITDVARARGMVVDEREPLMLLEDRRPRRRLNVATTPHHPRRGYGAALSARTLLDGLTTGARRALLMSSELGRPVYQRFGFRELEQWSYWLPAGAAEG